MTFTEYTQGACIISMKATANLPKHRFISFTGGLCGSAQKGAGVSRHAADSGQIVAVITDQVPLVEVGTAVTKGAAVASDASGRVAPDSGGAIMGYALEAGSPGDFIPILLK